MYLASSVSARNMSFCNSYSDSSYRLPMIGNLGMSELSAV